MGAVQWSRQGDPWGDPQGIQGGSWSFSRDPSFGEYNKYQLWLGDPIRPLHPCIILKGETRNPHAFFFAGGRGAALPPKVGVLEFYHDLVRTGAAASAEVRQLVV